MTTVTEADVLRACFEYLLYIGALVLRVNSGAVQPESDGGKARFVSFYKWQILGDDQHIAGVSDLVALVEGKLICVEVKRPGKLQNVTDDQMRFLAAVKARGGIGLVVDSLDKLISELEARITR